MPSAGIPIAGRFARLHDPAGALCLFPGNGVGARCAPPLTGGAELLRMQLIGGGGEVFSVKRVIVSAGAEVREALIRTVLLRHDIQVTWSEDLHAAFQLLFRERCDLFVAHSPESRALPYTLHEFGKRYPAAHFPILALSDSVPAEEFPPSVQRVFPVGFDAGTFNDAVADLLRLPTRRSARLPIRMGLSLAHHPGTQIANTVNLSASGMLVEAFKPLTPGKVYEFRFLCKGNCSEQPVLKARVLRSEGRARPGVSAETYALEFIDVPPEAMETFLQTVLSL